MSQGIIPTVLSIAEARGGSVEHRRDDGEGLLEDFSARLVVQFAGRAAEDVILGSPSCGAGGLDVSDLGRATSMLARIEGRRGLGSRLSMSDEVDGAVIEARLRRAYPEATLLVMRHRQEIISLAKLALRDRIIGEVGPAAVLVGTGWRACRRAFAVPRPFAPSWYGEGGWQLGVRFVRAS